ncbi:hypothetical protein BDR03DRAFT_250743 [Suillus americanus]|nr:hypothetical protein BDR03DRAFT_250743 [Suillus americanus]
MRHYNQRKVRPRKIKHLVFCAPSYLVIPNVLSGPTSRQSISMPTWLVPASQQSVTSQPPFVVDFSSLTACLKFCILVPASAPSAHFFRC